MKLKDGKYTITEKLGQGGFGITYLATTLAEVKGKVNGKNKKMYAKAQVVVKEFFMEDYCKRAEGNQSVRVVSKGQADLVEAYRNKFKKEAGKLSKMDHPNIVKVTDVIDDENNTSYYVMSFLGGGTLYKLVRPDENTVQPLSEGKAVKYVKQIADALGYMHKRMMCHFDVTPNNIMLDDEGNAVIIDFGMAKNYSKNGKKMSTVLVGATVGYAPLEQANANLDTFSPQTDIYALGATLYFLLTGHSPNAATFEMEAVLPNGPCGMSEHLWEVIQRCMQANPKDRPANIDAFMRMMDGVNVDENVTRPMPIHVPSFGDKIASTLKRHGKNAMLMILAITIGVGASWMMKYCHPDYHSNPDDPPVVLDTVAVDTISNENLNIHVDTAEEINNNKKTLNNLDHQLVYPKDSLARKALDNMDDKLVIHIDTSVDTKASLDNLDDALTAIANERNKHSERINYLSPTLSHYFSNPNVKVQVVDKDSKTIVNTTMASSYLNYLSIATKIEQVVVLEEQKDKNGKIVNLKVYEIHRK